MGMVSPNQLRAQGNSSPIFSANKSPTYLLPVGTSYCLVSVSHHYTNPTRLVSTFSIAFATGASMAAVSQLFSASVSSIYILYSIYNWNVYGCSLPVVFQLM